MTVINTAGIQDIDFYLPESMVSNEMISRENPDWDMLKASERSGVLSRPIAPDGVTALDMGFLATEKLFKHAPLEIDDVDALIFCTQTPDYILPPNSTLLHGRLGLKQSVMSFDITHACSGYIYSVGIANSLVRSGAAKNVLIVTSDTYSRLIHPQDRSTRPIFGDGAAACLVTDHSLFLHIKDIEYGTSGDLANRFIVKQGGMRFPGKANSGDIISSNGRINSPDHIYMDGFGVLSFFNKIVPASVRSILKNNQLEISSISKFIFHQASQLALDSIKKSLNIPTDKVVIDMANTGNLVSSSIPVILTKLKADGQIQSGDWVIISGFGVGLSWGTILAKA